MEPMRKILVVLMLFCGCSSYEQQFYSKQLDSYEITGDEIIIVDTIGISNPVLIRFNQYLDTLITKSQYVLVPSQVLESVPFDDQISFEDFYLSRGYLFLTSYRFSKLLNGFMFNYKGDGRRDLKHLQNQIEAYKNTREWVGDKKKQSDHKTYKGWTYADIYPREFVFCLIKGEVLAHSQSIDEIDLREMSNVYFKVLIPYYSDSLLSSPYLPSVE
jgi:hypothetical protein